MITMGNDFGGSELRGSLIHKMLNKAMNVAADTREPGFDSGKEAWINPIYIVPGSIYKPEFEGYKLGHFSAKKKGLVIMIAVPQSVADGKDIEEFVINSLREAIRLGAEHFASKGIDFDALKAEKIVHVIEKSMKQPA